VLGPPDRGETAPFRPERALSAAALCGPGGVAAHVAAGGQAPTLLGWVLLCAASVLVAGLLVRARLGPGLLLVAAGGTQLALHHLLGTAASMQHLHAAGPSATPSDDAGVLMLLMHLAVALVVAAVAAGVESSWWRLALAVAWAAWRRVLGLPARVAPVPSHRPLAPAVDHPPVAAAYDVVAVEGPRGPPVAAAPVPLHP
jgi:hypothetical protein